MNYNKAILVGRIANDIRLSKTSSGVSYARARLAIRRNSTIDTEVTDFVPLVAWRQTADLMANYAPKGSLVMIEGAVVTSTREVNGQQITNVEIRVDGFHFLEPRSVREQRHNPNFDPNSTTYFANNNKTNYQPTQQNVKTNQNNQNINFDTFMDDDKFTGSPSQTVNQLHEINFQMDFDDED
ncbi:single-stranded DNA-binding protein [Mycoplasmopsis felifaucium]|uniref:Single-stranded DNA-binding protein n=1 Tax=Mycoplasmopsis felifaucium TaxID=35768 RepID=A0ABZ2RW63_9BACT